MKIGDKVRFLNDVGGGVITGFPDKNTVLVCDDDGFEIPTLMNEVVVVDTNEYNIQRKQIEAPKTKKKAAEPTSVPTSIKQALSVGELEEEEQEDLADKEITYKPMAQERRGANELNFLLSFVPKNIKSLSDSPLEVYLINDCNYYLNFAIFTHEGNSCMLRHAGELMPNTKFFVEEVKHADLEVWERITVQVIAYKREKLFIPKPAMNISVRVEGAKFFKLHAFRTSAFFKEPALFFDIIKEDKPVRDAFIDPEQLRDAMQTPLMPPVQQPDRVENAKKKRTNNNELLEVDLHSDELFDTLVGLGPKDILEYQIKVFKDTMNEHLKEKGRKIVFIHGKGDGVLRKAILKELSLHYKQCYVQDASFREYGYGATMVTL